MKTRKSIRNSDTKSSMLHIPWNLIGIIGFLLFGGVLLMTLYPAQACQAQEAGFVTETETSEMSEEEPEDMSEDMSESKAEEEPLGIPDVVRVGCFDYGGFWDTSGENGRRGYVRDYMEKSSEYTQWHYELLRGKRDNIMQQLLDGEIDFAWDILVDDQRKEGVLYSDSPIILLAKHLYTKEDNTDLYYEDFEQYSDKTVGILSYTGDQQTLDKYEKRYQFSCSRIEYDTVEQLLWALDHDEVDMILYAGLQGKGNYKDLGMAGVLKVYGITLANREELMESWNEGRTLLQLFSENILTTLYKTYYMEQGEFGRPSYTREEMQYMQSASEIPVALMKNLPGLSEYDEATGEYYGVLVDVMKLIEERSGLQFSYIEMERGVRATEVIGQYHGNAIVPLIISDETKMEEEAVLVNTNFTGFRVFAKRKNETIDVTQDLRIALTKSSFGVKKMLLNLFPNAKFLTYHDTKDCLYAVRDKKADVVVSDMVMLQNLMADPRLEDLEITTEFFFLERVCLILSEQTDERLVSILEKSVSTIEEAKLNQMNIERAMSVATNQSVGDFIYRHRNQISLFFSLLAAGLIILAVLVVYRSRQEMLLQVRNEQLQEAIEQVQSANTAKTTFLARISHEIRTPLNAITGIATLAENHISEPGQVQEDLDKIKQASQILLELVNDILDMSAIEKDAMTIASDPFYLRDVLDSTQSVYEALCTQKGIDFRVERSGEIDTRLFGDALRLKQIINNLLSNAWKFTERNGIICLKVMTHRTGPEELYVSVSVSDTGCGISDEMMSRIFKPFQQENAEMTRKYGGSGLGLSICKNLVELMHGSIQVESTKNMGTTFRLSIPFHCDAVQAGEQITKKTERKEYDFHGAKVLLVEDNELNRDIAKELLQMVHLNVDSAEDGEQALELFTNHEEGYYSLILTDIQMPFIDGYELARIIRGLKREDAKTIPIVAMTANAFKEDVALSVAAGMNGHITKPIDSAAMYQKIDTLLQEQRM